jgi:hypothetical protein
VARQDGCPCDGMDGRGGGVDYHRCDDRGRRQGVISLRALMSYRHGVFELRVALKETRLFNAYRAPDLQILPDRSRERSRRAEAGKCRLGNRWGIVMMSITMHHSVEDQVLERLASLGGMLAMPQKCLA